MTATTVALVLVALAYAYQVLEQQRGTAEFEVAKKSILAFNDALENVALGSPGGTRSVRFTIDYGHLELKPNENIIGINATVGGSTHELSNSTFPGYTGILQYFLSTNYVTFGEGYELYILGNSSTVIVGSTSSYGRAVIRQQQAGLISITLDHQVRAMRTSVDNIGGNDTNHVVIWVTKISMLVASPWSYVHDFDLKAKHLNLLTTTHGPYDVNGNQTGIISVKIGSDLSSAPITLVATENSKVVFDVVVAEIQVSV